MPGIPQIAALRFAGPGGAGELWVLRIVRAGGADDA